MKASTALALVKTIQSYAPASAHARSSASMSSGGAIRIVGAWMASAPRSSSMSTSSAACSRERVTTIRLPKSGRASNQRRCSRNPATRPMTSMAGSCGRARSTIVPSVPTIVACAGVVPA